MNNKEEKKCPLCTEEMDWTDQQLKPCKCGYEVCVWCWHHIMEMAEKDEFEGQCPACRTPYDKERIVGMEANCKRVVATKKEKKTKPQKAKPKKPEEFKDLSGVRVIQRKMAYVFGLPLSLANENLLQRKEFFGQYGKVTKVSLSRTAGGAIQQFVNETCSVYVTYSKEEEAIRCIQSIHGFVLEGRFLSIGAEEDSFSKDEEAAVHTRNRVNQIVGGTHNLQQGSGNILPPPRDDTLNFNGVATGNAIVGSALKDTAHVALIPNDHLNCSLSSKDRDGRIKTPNKTFVDIVEGSSCVPERDGRVAEEEVNHLEMEYSNSLLKRVSSSYHLPIELPGSCSEVREDFLSFHDQRSRCSDSLSQGSSVLSSSYPIGIPDHSNDHAQQRKETHVFSGCNMERSTVHDHVDEASIRFTYANSAMVDGYNGSNFKNSTKFDRNLRPSNSFSNEEIMEHLRRLDGNDIVHDAETSALDVVESSIISNILSIDFDSCDDSLTSSHNLAELLDQTGGQRGYRKFCNNEESRFSFTKRGSFANQEPDLDSSFNSIGQASKKHSSLPDAIKKEEFYSWGPQNNVSRAQSLIPPGFSVPSRIPPPGFPPCKRSHQALSGNHLVKTSSLPNGQFLLGSTTNITNNHDFFVNPSIMVVGGGKSTKTMNSNSLFEARSSSTPQTYKDEARLWLLMQQSTSATDQDPTFPSTFVQEAPTAQQDLICPGRTGGNDFSSMGDTFGHTSMLMDPQNSYNPSLVPQLCRQKYSNGHMSNSYVGGLDESRLRNEMGTTEVQRNERIGLNKFFSGYNGDLMLQMPSPADVYNRVYGL